MSERAKVLIPLKETLSSGPEVHRHPHSKEWVEQLSPIGGRDKYLMRGSPLFEAAWLLLLGTTVRVEVSVATHYFQLAGSGWAHPLPRSPLSGDSGIQIVPIAWQMFGLLSLLGDGR